MRKIQLLAGLLLLSGTIFISSCKKDSTTTDVTYPPTVNFKGGTAYTSINTTLFTGQEFLVGITAQANATSGKKLVNFKAARTFNNITTVEVNTTIDSDNFTWEQQFFANTNVGDERWTFTITDKDGESNEVYFVITTEATAADINSFSDVILGSYDNTAHGSSFASSTGAVYFLADAKVNAAKVDWLYFYGVTNQATLAAPDDAAAATLFNSTTNGLQTWSIRNATRFRLATGGAVWDNITTAADIADIAVNTTETKVNLLEVGNIVVFKTVGNKLGVIKIDGLVTGAAGSITYSVKVQK
jgi:hypothetical protein